MQQVSGNTIFIFILFYLPANVFCYTDNIVPTQKNTDALMLFWWVYNATNGFLIVTQNNTISIYATA